MGNKRNKNKQQATFLFLCFFIQPWIQVEFVLYSSTNKIILLVKKKDNQIEEKQTIKNEDDKLKQKQRKIKKETAIFSCIRQQYSIKN